MSATCPSCGTEMDCNPGGACWCAELPFTLPLPADASAACLCPDCLRRLHEDIMKRRPAG